MRIDFERVFNANIERWMKDFHTCTVAKVLNTDNLKDGFVTVQPLVNYVAGSLETTERANISYVPVIMPSTTHCGMVFPVKKGDTCLLIIGENSSDDFKLGSNTPHDATRLDRNSLDFAVAFVGFNITQESVFNPKNHSEDYSESSVKVFNNKGTQSECFVELKESGDVDVRSPTQINANAPVVNAKDVIIEGVGSVKQFMLSHNHNYLDDGNTMITDPPNPL